LIETATIGHREKTVIRSAPFWRCFGIGKVVAASVKKSDFTSKVLETPINLALEDAIGE
jgi:hypothetical protein